MQKYRSVGIRELKNHASSIIERVRRSRTPIAVSRNNKEVARIVPVTDDPAEELIASGLLSSPPRQPWAELQLEPIGADASSALAALRADRNR